MDPLSVLNKWKRAIGNIDTIFQRAMLDNDQEIIRANVAQLEVGEDSLGNSLLPYVSDNYATWKHDSLKSKAPFGIADLKVTGAFHDGFFLAPSGPDALIIDSSDEKSGALKVKYGKEIMGLQTDSQEDLNPGIIQSFINHFRNELL